MKSFSHTLVPSVYIVNCERQQLYILLFGVNSLNGSGRKQPGEGVGQSFYSHGFMVRE